MLKKLMKKWEDAMAAVTFAEAGEFETAREFLKTRQKVLLVLTGRQSDRNSFKYALNICKRIDAGLEILFIASNDEVPPVVNEFQNVLQGEGIDSETILGRGCVKEAIIRHTEKRNDIQFVVIESSEALDIVCSKDDRELTRTWERLKFPLVMVSEA